MNPKIIIVTGYLAAGKSTFARQLSSSLSVPYIIKDTFKSALCANVDVIERKESSRFSVVTFDGIIYIAERLIETGFPTIIEGNFVPQGIKIIDEAGTIKALLNKYNCRSLTYKFVGDTRILHKRFVDRDKLPERGQVNMWPYEPTHGEFDIWCHNLDGFNVGGEIIEVDTTDFNAINFERHIETARRFLGGK